MTRAVKLHLASEFLPVLAFYVVSQWEDFTTSAVVLAGTTLLATTASLWYEKRIPLVSVSSSLFVVGAGVLSYGLTMPDILIMADSLYYFLTAGVLWWYLKRGHFVLQWVFDGAFTMALRGWYLLTWRWIIASTIAGVGNEVVRLFLTPDAWINYKLVKVLLVVLFVASQFYLAKHYQVTASTANTTPSIS
jgi:intracellular septation protein A